VPAFAEVPVKSSDLRDPPDSWLYFQVVTFLATRNINVRSLDRLIRSSMSCMRWFCVCKASPHPPTVWICIQVVTFLATRNINVRSLDRLIRSSMSCVGWFCVCKVSPDPPTFWMCIKVRYFSDDCECLFRKPLDHLIRSVISCMGLFLRCNRQNVNRSSRSI
jgi:hypothetical protein